MAAAPRLALCGGVALYLIGHVGFRWRLAGTLEREKVAVAAALLVVFASQAASTRGCWRRSWPC